MRRFILHFLLEDNQHAYDLCMKENKQQRG
jgi:hypothetical protein